MAVLKSYDSRGSYGADCATLSGKDAMRCVDYRQRKTNAQISRETVELLKGYWQCIQKHESDMAKAKKR